MCRIIRCHSTFGHKGGLIRKSATKIAIGHIIEKLNVLVCFYDEQFPVGIAVLGMYLGNASVLSRIANKVTFGCFCEIFHVLGNLFCR